MDNFAKKQVIFKEGMIHDVVVYALNKYYDERGWLAELFRSDEIAEEFMPEMAYISITKPGIRRGPHEHIAQADLFCFMGPSTFELLIWDRRSGSDSYNVVMRVVAGEDDPKAVIVPKRLAHAYTNIGKTDGLVINCPNRLYRGKNKAEEIDEIRHEDDPETIYRFE